MRTYRSFPLAVLILASVVHAQTLPVVATWHEDRKAAVSLTFDDNHPVQLEHALRELNQRNLKGTFFVITGMAYWGNQDGWEPFNWSRTRPMVDAGHEIAGHSVTHVGQDINEVKQCIDTLRRYIPEKKWWTWAYPGGNTRHQSEVMKYTVAARGYSIAIVEDSTPVDIYNVKTTGILGTTANINTALSKRGWLVETLHCISSNTLRCEHGHNTLLNDFVRHLDTLVMMKDQLWIATFGDVARYLRQRNAAQVRLVSSTTTQRVFSLTDTLPNDAFDLPLTLKMTLPSGWEGCEVVQANVTTSAKIQGNTALFHAVPDRGEITVRRSGATRTRGASEVARGVPISFRGADRAVWLTLGSKVDRLQVEIYRIDGRRISALEFFSKGPGDLEIPLPSRGVGLVRVRYNGDQVLHVLASTLK